MQSSLLVYPNLSTLPFQTLCTELLLFLCGFHALMMMTGYRIGSVLIGPRGHDRAGKHQRPSAVDYAVLGYYAIHVDTVGRSDLSHCYIYHTSRLHRSIPDLSPL
jgi:hypothetical protein